MRFVLHTVQLLAIPLLGLSACAQTGFPVVERQEIGVTLVPEKHLLIGESKVIITGAAKGITFNLSPASVIDRVVLADRDVPFLFKGGVLVIDLPKGGGRAPLTVQVAYHAIFNDPMPQFPVNSEEPTYGVNASITSRGTFLGGSAGWYPRPQVTPRQRTIRISAPAGTEAVTAGRRVSRSTDQGGSVSIWSEERPAGLLSLSAGPYRIAGRRAGGVDIYTYFYPENAGLSERYLEAVARYIRFYAERFGPYPFEKFAVVENFLPTGYGFPSYTLLGSSIIRLPFIIETSLPHEIAHNWWGNGVMVDDSGGNWSEGLVTYLADYLLEEQRLPAAGRDYRLRILSDYAALVPPDRDFPLRNFIGRVDPASRAIGYGKGAMLFHMVRSLIGDDAFFGALREVCQDRLYRTATWNDFVRAFSKRAGKELAPFMEQWLVRPGGPSLALSDVVSRREGLQWVVSGTIVQTHPLYALSLPLRLETAGEALRTVVPVRGERTVFSVSATAPPRRLLMDPDAEVFRLLSSAEVPPTVNHIKGSERLLVVVTGSCRASEETLGRFLESLGQQNAAVVAEEQADAMALRGYDLLFCGAPRKPGAFPPLPGGIALVGRGFDVEGERYAAPDSLLFLVQPRPAEPGRVAALFMPLSEEAAKRYALKITHYGTYGYLVFTGGDNRLKRRFPPSGGESFVVFNGKSIP